MIDRLHQALRGATLFACSTVLLLALGSQGALRAAAQSASPGRAASPAASSTSEGPQRLLWLRAFDGEQAASELQLRVERALARALGELGYVPNRSPLPFREAQLASGCVGGLRECGARVAAALESEQLIVSELDTPTATGATTSLALYRFEGGQLVANGTALLPLQAAEELELTVRALAESVFGTRAAPLAARAQRTPEPSSAQSQAAPATASAAQGAAHPEASTTERGTARGMPALRGVGWTALVLGGAGAIGAVATAVSAQRQSEAYGRTEVATSQDVDAALEHYDRAEHKAEIARVLGGVSAGVVAAGAFMLLWEHFASRRDRNLQSLPTGQAVRSPRQGVRAAAWPQRTGVTVSLGVQL